MSTYKTTIDNDKWKKVSGEELAKVNLSKDEFHGKWNYKICPNK
jgi:hypothetical protein